MAIVRINPETGKETKLNQESTPAYLARNLARGLITEPAVALGSGLGLGNILDVFQRNIFDPGAEYLKEKGAPSALVETFKPRRMIPTSEEVRGALSHIQPEYLNQVRPGDEPLQFIAENAIPFALSGGFQGAIPALKAGAGLAGTHIGSRTAQQGAKLAGAGELGQTFAALGGGLAGGVAANMAVNRPSKALAQGVKEQNIAEFEQGKAQRLAEVAEKFEPQIKQKTAEINQLKKNYTQELAQKKELRNKNIEGLARQQTSRQKKIEALEQKRAPLYEEAHGIAPHISEPFPELGATLKNLKNDLLGIPKAERRPYMDILKQAAKAMKGGELTLADAVQLKQNINARLAHKSAFTNENTAAINRHIKKFNTQLNDFIKQAGENNPEHGRPFSQAEQASIEKAKLAEEVKQLKKTEKQSQRDIINKYKESLEEPKAQFKEGVKKATEELKASKAEYENTRNAIGKETYDKAFANEKKSLDSTETLAKALRGANELGQSAGLGYILRVFGFDPMVYAGVGALRMFGQPILNEMKALAKVWHDHPTVFKAYARQLTNDIATQSPNISATLNRFGNASNKRRKRK